MTDIIEGDLIEAMAKAICEAELGSADKSAIELFNGRFDRHVRAALAAAAERGYVLVPIEPTIEMSAEGNRPVEPLELKHGILVSSGIPDEIYRAMIAAGRVG